MTSHLANKCRLDFLPSYPSPSPSHHKWTQLSSEEKMEARLHKFGIEKTPQRLITLFYDPLPHS